MHILNNEIAQAICWTLIHSLWQGLLLAIIAGVVIMITKKSTAALRYNILAGLFFTFILISCFTFFNELNFFEKNNIDENLTLINTQQPINNAIQSPANIVIEKNYGDIFTNYFNEHASLVVAIWFIVLSAQIIKMLANVGYIQRIKNYKTHAPSAFWKNKTRQLAKNLQIKKHIALLESEIVKVPVLVGFLKPVILFPFSLMSQLSPEQIEAVLLHELAHVKRKDYFVNLLQSFAEIIFFFNPGVLWISSLIRDERENCCDDIAIHHTKNKKEFIHALVVFQEYNMARSKYAIAFPGQKNHLLNRVKRILTSNNKTLNNMEKITLASGIIIISLATFAFAQTTKPVTDKVAGTRKQVINASGNISGTGEIKDTVPETEQNGKRVIVSKIDDVEYKLIEVNNKLSAFYVDGKKIPADKIEDYRSIIDKIYDDEKLNEEKLALQQVELKKQQELLMQQQEEFQKKADELHKLEENKLATINREELNKKEEELNRQMDLVKIQQEKWSKEQDADINKKLQREIQLQKIQLEAAQLQLEKAQREMEQIQLKKPDADLSKQNEMLAKRSAELQMQQLQLQSSELKLSEEALQLQLQPSLGLTLKSPTPEINGLTEIQSPVPPAPLIKENDIIKSVINDLKNENIISDEDPLSFTLNSKTFKVNDVVQPKSVQDEFKEKYIKHPKDHVIYSTSHGSTHGDINIDN
jgi:bla regulator protein blaR1